MKTEKQTSHIKQQKAVWMMNGRLYFRKDTERLIYFILTVIMLAAGLLVQLGLI